MDSEALSLVPGMVEAARANLAECQEALGDSIKLDPPSFALGILTTLMAVEGEYPPDHLRENRDEILYMLDAMTSLRQP